MGKKKTEMHSFSLTVYPEVRLFLFVLWKVRKKKKKKKKKTQLSGRRHQFAGAKLQTRHHTALGTVLFFFGSTTFKNKRLAINKSEVSFFVFVVVVVVVVCHLSCLRRCLFPKLYSSSTW